MKIYSKKKIETKQLSKVVCDYCKKEGTIFGINSDKKSFCGGVISISFSYPSKFDSKEFELDICDECFEKHFRKVINKG